MQLARQLSRESDAPLRKGSALRSASDQSGPGGASPARELQAALQSAFDEGALAPPEPEVLAWPGWARLVVLTAGTALAWAAVIGAVKLLASN